MRLIATDRVAWSVYLSVSWSRSWARQRRVNRSPGWVTRVGPRNHGLDGGTDPLMGMDNFRRCQAHWRAFWVTTDVYAAKINDGISATAAADCIAPDLVSYWLRRWCRHLANYTKHIRGYSFHHMETWRHPQKPEVHNVSHCRKRRSKPQPQITRTQNLAKCGFWDMRAGHRYRQTDKRADTLIAILRTPTRGSK